MLLVSGLGANAKASGAVCPAAGCWRDGAVSVLSTPVPAAVPSLLKTAYAPEEVPT